MHVVLLILHELRVSELLLSGNASSVNPISVYLLYLRWNWWREPAVST